MRVCLLRQEANGHSAVETSCPFIHPHFGGDTLFYVTRGAAKSWGLSVVFAAAMAAAVAAEGTSPDQGADWCEFLGPTGNNRSSESGLNLSWTTTPPTVRWQVSMGSGYATCAVYQHRVFLFDRVDDQARLRCVRRDTAEEVWQYRYATHYDDAFGYDNGPRCSPITDGERVFILGVEGELHCVAVEDGRRLWSLATNAEFGVVPNFFGVGSTPVLFDDCLLMMVGGSPPDQSSLPPGQLDRVEGNGSGIVAFEKSTGRMRYQISDELASYASIRLAHIGERDWGFAFARGGLVGFDPKAGRVDFAMPWRARTLESVNASSPVVVGNEVFVTECYGPGGCKVACRPSGYDIVWRDPADRRERSLAAHWNTPVWHDGHLYGSSGRHAQSAELRCIDWKTGDVKWKQTGLGRASLLYLDEHLVCLSEDGTVRLIQANPEAYQLVSQLDLGATGKGLLRYPAWAAPVLSHGCLYLRGADCLVCLDLQRSR